MERFFYHGCADWWDYGFCLGQMLSIAKEGIWARNKNLNHDENEINKYNHVCLYRKNVLCRA